MEVIKKEWNKNSRGNKYNRRKFSSKLFYSYSNPHTFQWEVSANRICRARYDQIKKKEKNAMK